MQITVIVVCFFCLADVSQEKYVMKTQAMDQCETSHLIKNNSDLALLVVKRVYSENSLTCVHVFEWYKNGFLKAERVLKMTNILVNLSQLPKQ